LQDERFLDEDHLMILTKKEECLQEL